ncbi:hypothetical protein DERP_008852 [Dermatophagoides pteronyssinus]|uniref:Uncharacterized protein n=1 Tax=Dermatophagoides pteronyssinus TaxID=6956 RepID=A0ABQ8JN75_DERPT|nr:hypothetical protein DERP_008852 [Dermatophagoides pteronyssinus]
MSRGNKNILMMNIKTGMDRFYTSSGRFIITNLFRYGPSIHENILKNFNLRPSSSSFHQIRCL